ncbi:MAG: cupredoxin domain-containing protein [Bdellovibrionaceae bacterium]|nr:cupredoxin domain-containing protein [Pseudobdellovibrionaceae bacterium]MBX3034847.1 cupredoxin domain-containing protein [Pseudobdellovibrionaceae bacterium]
MVLAFVPGESASAWEVDLSRRQLDFDRVTNQSRLPASTQVTETVGLLDQALESSGPTQDIVIMNTDKGFVPEAVHLRKGGSYKIHVVNVNSKDRNVSFVLDAFSEHHNTLFGQAKTFTVTPKQDGVFTYQCPETAAQGRLVIMPSDRKPASN